MVAMVTRCAHCPLNYDNGLECRHPIPGDALGDWEPEAFPDDCPLGHEPLTIAREG